jgi:hypothetical protein
MEVKLGLDFQDRGDGNPCVVSLQPCCATWLLFQVRVNRPNGSSSPSSFGCSTVMALVPWNRPTRVKFVGLQKYLLALCIIQGFSSRVV